MKKLNRHISWDEYFMGIAKLSALRSKDPNTQVGCCIVDQNNKICSLGYNGFPWGCNDKQFPWKREGKPVETKYLYVVHAEINAICNYVGPSLAGCKIYVSLFPCHDCTKAIIQSGIKEIVYESDKYATTDSIIAAKRMCLAAGVKTRMYIPTKRSINITL